MGFFALESNHQGCPLYGRRPGKERENTGLPLVSSLTLINSYICYEMCKTKQ